eukprot:scaffold660_cov57-Attheya_sp.AAC.4
MVGEDTENSRRGNIKNHHLLTPERENCGSRRRWLRLGFSVGRADEHRMFNRLGQFKQQCEKGDGNNGRHLGRWRNSNVIIKPNDIMYI